MKKNEKNDTARAAMGTPVALCNLCAPLYIEAFETEKVFLSDRTVVCENCRKRKMGARYKIGKPKSNKNSGETAT